MPQGSQSSNIPAVLYLLPPEGNKLARQHPSHHVILLASSDFLCEIIQPGKQKKYQDDLGAEIKTRLVDTPPAMLPSFDKRFGSPYQQ
jgi:hypothetical protein